MNQWISVNDKLPENTDDVLGWDAGDDCCVVCYWLAVSKDWFQYNVDDKLFITHWMPLPTKPE